MADVNIKGKIQVDTGTSAATMKELKDNIKNLKAELDGAKIGSQEYTKASERLKAAQAQLSASTKEKTNNFAQLKESLKGTVPAFDGAAGGAASLGKQFLALLANPIVLLIAAIVAGLKFLYDAFTSTVAGGKKMEQVFEGLKAALQVVTDRVFMLGNAVIKFFSGDFKGAISDAKAAVTGVGDAIQKVYDRTAQITKRLQELKKEQREDDVDKARRERDLALLREKLNDESVPLRERLNAAKVLRDEQKKNAEDDLKRSTEIANLKIEKLKQQKDGELKNADEIAELQKSIFETEKENALEGVRTNKVLRNLQKQQADEWAEQAAELARLQKEKLDAEYKLELDAYNKRKKLRGNEHAEMINMTNERAKMRDDEEKRKKFFDEKLQKLEKESNESGLGNLLIQKAKEKGLLLEADDAKRKINEGYIEHKKVLFSQEVQLAMSLADLVGQQTVVGKGIAAAAASINTYQAASEALKANYGPFGPAAAIARIIAVASTIALGLRQVKGILSVNVPGTSSSISAPGISSASAAATSASAPIAPTQSSTQLNQNSIQAIGNAAAGGVTRAFVLDADIKNNAERAARINRAARLG